MQRLVIQVRRYVPVATVCAWSKPTWTDAMCPCMQFKLVKGKRYERDMSRLDCMSASRFLLNRNLENCLQGADSQQ